MANLIGKNTTKYKLNTLLFNMNIKTLKLIHLALCAGVTVAYVVLNNIESVNAIFSFSEISSEDYFFIAIPIFAFLTSNFIYKLMLKKINKNESLEDNFMVFQTASIVRWAILEGAAFLILFLKPELIIFGILILMYLLLLRPTEDRFKNDTNLI